jgi:hypothetical protein
MAQQEAYARGVADLREVMEESTFRAAWNAGRALLLDEAIAEASTLAEAIVQVPLALG